MITICLIDLVLIVLIYCFYLDRKRFYEARCKSMFLQNRMLQKRINDLESEQVEYLKTNLENVRIESLINMITKHHPDGSWPAFSMDEVYTLATHIKENKKETGTPEDKSCSVPESEHRCMDHLDYWEDNAGFTFVGCKVCRKGMPDDPEKQRECVG